MFDANTEHRIICAAWVNCRVRIYAKDGVTYRGNGVVIGVKQNYPRIKPYQYTALVAWRWTIDDTEEPLACLQLEGE